MHKGTHWIFSIILFWSFTFSDSNLIRNSIHISNACYGVHNNVLHLHCKSPKVIKKVIQMIFATKAESEHCPKVTNEANYKEGCCTLRDGDCTVSVINEHDFSHCIGMQECSHLSTWMLIGNKCEQGVYPQYSSFMAIKYLCGEPEGKKSTTEMTTAKVTAATNTSLRMSTTEKSLPVTKNTPDNIVKSVTKTTKGKNYNSTSTTENTNVAPIRAESEQPALMLGAIIAITCGVIGMLLSVLCLWIYCRTKNQTSPDPDTHKVPTRFWNNILPQSLTPKSFGKGYNNFTSFMPSSYPAFPYKDGQHAHILRSTSDASQSDQSVSSCGNQLSERSPPNTPSKSRSPQDGAPFAFTIVNNLAT
ncbi:uncharacterized protein LOC106875897 [Octopus bimaculoides]|uniref:SUEL-type lectin domain-containing protein n=1 Tax=Octopus bimaculoides TaxID=37653 RepID=A0A0L8GMW1_OCTBM|nr:uncharacterized protein LOC106875897 [Octopus bimaculoides]|eukprot:XP_014779689.1 PREDICTED: uncharacterized protein LOC106875897 [Octopus bimaculoides]